MRRYLRTTGIRKAAKQVVHLWVQDNGIGISAEDQTKIFREIFPLRRYEGARIARHWLGLEHHQESPPKCRAGAFGSKASSEKALPSISPFPLRKEFRNHDLRAFSTAWNF
ncbi:MAG: hypothetical protein U0X93_05435 [Anaerolineales bacterium]